MNELSKGKLLGLLFFLIETHASRLTAWFANRSHLSGSRLQPHFHKNGDRGTDSIQNPNSSRSIEKPININYEY
jgi:hypothetical protein